MAELVDFAVRFNIFVESLQQIMDHDEHAHLIRLDVLRSIVTHVVYPWAAELDLSHLAVVSKLSIVSIALSMNDLISVI
jgi:hypothetical protein